MIFKLSRWYAKDCSIIDCFNPKDGCQKYNSNYTGDSIISSCMNNHLYGKINQNPLDGQCYKKF